MKKFFYLCSVTAFIVSMAFLMPNIADAANGQPFQILDAAIEAAEAAAAAALSSEEAAREAADAAEEAARILGDNDLSEAIQSNADAIAENATAIGAIQTEIDDIDITIAGIEEDVQANVDAIFVLNGSVSDLQTDLSITIYNVNLLSADFLALKTKHGEDMVDLQTQIDAQKGLIVGLRTDLNNASIELADQIAVLQTEVDGNTSGVSQLLIDVSVLNGQVTTMNITLNDHERRLGDLEADVAAINTELDDVQLALSELEIRVGDFESIGDQGTNQLATFVGIQTNLPIASLNGWEECYSDKYSNNAKWAADVVKNKCTKSRLMLACRWTGSDTLIVAAHAARADVLFDVGTARKVTHEANGVAWYYNGDYSWGFAEPGDGVDRDSCDNTRGFYPERRLCWHTHVSFGYGYRCGGTRGLNHSNAFERIIYQAD